MTKEEIENQNQLREFVDYHDLRNQYSIINFMASVSIVTASNKILNKEMRVMISFDGYDNSGSVTLIDESIDSYHFPTSFLAKWQEMKHEEKTFLSIIGKHPKNTIGNYTAQIIPRKIIA